MQNNPQIKVIIDTNLWISFLIGKRLGNLKELIIITYQDFLVEMNL